MTGRIAVLGQGAWGTALATTWREAGRDVTAWNRNSDDEDLADADIVVAAVPAQATREVLTRVAPNLAGDATIVLAAKGLERGTMRRQSEIATEAVPAHELAVLSGPGFSADLLAGLPTAVTLATNSRDAQALQERLATPGLRPYLSGDVVGAELGGALKNVIAISCGVTIGAGLGESARAALLTRGFGEMVRMALALGARAETLSGLSGLGDLVLTASSELSRNYSYGLAVGRTGQAPEEGTYEGAKTARAALDLAHGLGLEVPVIEMTAALVEGEIDVRDAAEALMHRPLKRE